MMTLPDLIRSHVDENTLSRLPPLPVSRLVDDSREVGRGDVFVAVAGSTSDGHDHVDEAIRRGAVAVLAERAPPLPPTADVPLVLVGDLNRLRGNLAARLHGDPSVELHCVGVTGTNGKTSIACFIAQLLERLGRPVGYLGTIGWGRLGELATSALTTESAIVVQRRLARLRDDGMLWAVLEASSHALHQHRLDDVRFEYAVFSNLTRDHLDYHGDLESYALAKRRLFTFETLQAAVINADDAFGRRFVEELAGDLAITTYGTANPADVCWSDVSADADGISAGLITPWGDADLHLPLYGEFTLHNVAASIAVLCLAGFPLNDVVAAAEHLEAVPGRMEFFPGSPTIVVDYAHTPDALEKMLAGLRPHVDGSLVCVFGCGGDRDAGKRPLMARAASLHADVLWLTSDNPRSEAPQHIVDQMRPGLLPGTTANECLDRLAAIEQAVAAAGERDLVVIAGKGHEDYQEIEGRRLPFSDREIAARLSAGGSTFEGGR